MKKVSLILLTLLMIGALIVPAFAATGAFVTSPTGRPAPIIVSFEPDSKGCTATLVITPYADRGQLSDEDCARIEEAYAQIAATSSSDAFAKILAELAKQLGVKTTDLAVSDLFDMDTTHCADHDAHGGFTVTLKIENAEKLAGVLHLNQAGWEICDIQEIDEDEDTVTFHGTEFSPFALVVATGDVELDRGGSNLWWIILLIILALVIGFVLWFFVFKKKDKKDEQPAAVENHEQQ
jgi:hypothetical protein